MNPSPLPERSFRFAPPQGPTLQGTVLGTAPSQVLFAPGNGFTVQCYAPALAPLTETVSIHGLNPRGHGGGDPPGPFADWDLFLADLRAYVEQRMEPPVIVVGHSFGAVLGLRLAAEAPHLVRGLLLMDPLVRTWNGEPSWVAGAVAAAEGELIEHTLMRRDRWSDRVEAGRYLAGRGSYRHWASEVLERFLESGLVDDGDGGVRLACPPGLEAAIYRTLPGKELFHWARRVRVPAAILRGEQSQYVHAAAVEALADVLPVAAVFGVKGTHTFPMEHPRGAGRALLAGLRMLLAPPSAGEPAQLPK